MRVLVTGAGGFIGRNLAESYSVDKEMYYWRRDGVYDRYGTLLMPHQVDLADFEGVKKVVDAVQPQGIIHLAAVSSPQDFAKRPDKLIGTNAGGTYNLLLAAPPGCRFVYASSATVYGTSWATVGGFKRFWECDRPAPASAYAASKLAGEHFVEAFTRLGKVSGVSLRLVAQVGKYSTHGLVHDVLRKLRSDAPELELLGESPGTCKPLMHAGDTCRALLHFLDNNHAEPLNVSTGDAITVEEVARICMAKAGVHKPLRWLGWGANFAGDQTQLHVSNYRAGCVGYSPVCEKSADAVAAGLGDILRVI